MWRFEHIKYTEANRNNWFVLLMNEVLVPIRCFLYFKIYLGIFTKIHFWSLVLLSAVGLRKKKLTKEDVFDFYLDDSF